MKTKMFEYRKAKGLLQKDVAAACGMSTRAYGSYEADEREPSLSALNTLADFFGVTVDELLGRTSEPDIFDNARIEQPEIMQLFERMTPEEQNNLVNYARGLISGRELRAAFERDRRFA
jgi:transcriptional regulator with XRE-family HTH domain